MNVSKDPNFNAFEDPNRNLTDLQKLIVDWKNLSDAHEVILTDLHGAVVDSFESRLTKVHVRIRGTDLLVFNLPITADDLASMQRHIEAVEVEPLFGGLLPRMVKLGWRIVPNPEIPNAEIRRLNMDPRPVVVSTTDGREVHYSQSYEGYYALFVDLERAEVRRRLIEAMPRFRAAGLKVRLRDGDIKWSDENGIGYTSSYIYDDVNIIFNQLTRAELENQM